MKPIQPIMSQVVAELVRPSPLSAEKVLFAWRMSVGTVLSRVTTVRLNGDGCLLVRLQDERWRPELERAAALVRQRMTAMLGADVLREIHLTAGVDPGAPRQRKPPAGTGRRSGAAAGASRAPAKTRPPAPATRKRSTR